MAQALHLRLSVVAQDLGQEVGLVLDHAPTLLPKDPRQPMKAIPALVEPLYARPP